VSTFSGSLARHSRILKHGTYLAQRWESQSGVNSYCYANEGCSLLVEVGVEDEQQVVLRSFVSSVPLEDYSHYVRLPNLP
jgi:hypothetical protein